MTIKTTTPHRFETATVYVSKGPDGWIFRAHYESDGVTKYFTTLEEGLREFSGDVIYFTEPKAEFAKLTRRYYSYDELRAAFLSGFASCHEGGDPDDGWDEHRSFLVREMEKEPEL